MIWNQLGYKLATQVPLYSLNVKGSLSVNIFRINTVAYSNPIIGKHITTIIILL